MKNLISAILLLILSVTVNVNISLAQWESTGPYGGFFMAGDFYENRIFANVINAGILKSSDNGISWHNVSDNVFIYATSIEVTSSSVFTAGGGNVYRSTNEGVFWESIGSGLPFYGGFGVIKSLNGFLLVSGDGTGFFRSTNNGNSWEDVNTEQTSFRTFFDYTSIGPYIFAVSSGIYRGDSLGENWIKIYDSVSDFSSIISDGSNIFAASYVNGVFRSTDYGSNWVEANNGLTNLHINSIKQLDSDLFVTADSTVFRSTNNGNSWIPVSNGLPQFKVNNLFVSESNVFVGCEVAGIYKTTDNGNNWIESNKGITSGNITSFASNYQFLFSVVNNGISFINRTSNSGITWTLLNNPIEGYLYEIKLTAKDNFIFCGIGNANGNQSGKIYRSSDNGDNWELINSGHNSVIFLAASPTDIYASFSNQGIFRSSDYGNNWISINNGLNTNQVFSSLISAGNYLIISSTYSSYRSNNNGESWISFNSGGGLFTDYSYNGSYLFAASEFGINRSSNYGSTWDYLSNGPATVNPGSISSSGFYIFAGNDSGIFYSDNNGLSWTKKNDGFNDNKKINRLFINEDKLFAGIENESGWKRSISDITNIQPYDVSVAQITEPVQDTIRYTDCDAYYNYFDFKTLVKNYSLNNQTAYFDVKLEVSYNGSVVKSETKHDNLSTGEEHILNFTSMGFYSQSTGKYTVKSWTILPLDSNNSNDTATSVFYIINPNFGGGLTSNAGYYFANSTSGANCAPDQPIFYWEDTAGSVSLISDGVANVPLSSGNLNDGYFILENILPDYLSFRFDFVCYNKFVLSTNGVIGLGESIAGLSNPNPQSIPNNIITGPAIFPLWYDLDFGVSSVIGRNLKYKVSGEKLIFTFDRVPSYGAVTSNDYVSFQVILDLTILCGPPWQNGTITVQYDNTKSGSAFLDKYSNNTLDAHTVGIQNLSGVGSLQYRYRNSTGEIITPGPLFSSPLAVSFGAENSVLPVELASFTSLVNQNNVTLNWQTSGETNNSGFDIERSGLDNKWSK
ncbi:MAG TPA: hypothetical protein PKA90_16495, partial [Ignavibacteria bacterium]|nr:hypothetical protein [Ignavibacteria bacterium]HMR42018.1 hypothetical protein [Ignavibacteria bacterium]